MNVHFSSHAKSSYNRNWAPIMNTIASAFMSKGYTCTKDPDLIWWQEKDGIDISAPDEGDVHIYTDCTHDKPTVKGIHVGLCGPMPGYFTLSSIGTWPHLEPTYTRPELNFPSPGWPIGDTESIVNHIKTTKINHFHNRHLNVGKDSPIADVPDNHVLVIAGQMDTGWRNGWKRFGIILNKLLSEQDSPIVVKFDPRYLLNAKGELDDSKVESNRAMIDSMEGNVISLVGLESLHDVLPKSRVCIMDEMVENLEPFMYDVPIVTVGAPPYRHFVKQIHHEHELISAIDDVSWHSSEKQRMWFDWFVANYACYDEESTLRRLEDFLEFPSF